MLVKGQLYTAILTLWGMSVGVLWCWLWLACVASAAALPPDPAAVAAAVADTHIVPAPAPAPAPAMPEGEFLSLMLLCPPPRLTFKAVSKRHVQNSGYCVHTIISNIIHILFESVKMCWLPYLIFFFAFGGKFVLSKKSHMINYNL